MTDETKSAAAPEARGPDAREREIHGLLNSDSFRSLRWTGDACGDECPPECPTCTYGADIAAALRAHPAGEPGERERAVYDVLARYPTIRAQFDKAGLQRIAAECVRAAPPPEGTSDE